MKRTKKSKNASLSNGAIRRCIVMMLLADLIADQVGDSDARLSGAAGIYVDFVYSYLHPSSKPELHKGTSALEAVKPTNVFLVWAVIRIADLSESQSEWHMYKALREAAQLHAQKWLPVPPPEQDMKAFISGLFGVVPEGAARQQGK